MYLDSRGRRASATPAADLANLSGEVVIAPVDGDANAGSTVRLVPAKGIDRTPHWAIFYPGGRVKPL